MHHSFRVDDRIRKNYILHFVNHELNLFLNNDIFNHVGLETFNLAGPLRGETHILLAAHPISRAHREQTANSQIQTYL